jgi:general secretion pathway protein L
MVTDRAWMRAALDQFAEHKHRRRHVVAAQLCLPLAAPVTAPNPRQSRNRRWPLQMVRISGPCRWAVGANRSGHSRYQSEQPATLVVEAATSTLAQSALLLDTAAPRRANCRACGN